MKALLRYSIVHFVTADQHSAHSTTHPNKRSLHAHRSLLVQGYHNENRSARVVQTAPLSSTSKVSVGVDTDGRGRIKMYLTQLLFSHQKVA